MNVDALLARVGLPPMDQAAVVPLAIAAGLVGVAALAGWLIRRRSHDRLAAWLHGLPHEPPGPLALRAGMLVGRGVAALLLGIALAAWPWPTFALIVIGTGFAATTALFVDTLLRGLSLGRATALATALIVFILTLSNAIGGLTRVQSSLSRIGFDVGTTRFSLLTLVNLLIAGIVIYALVRIAIRIVRRLTITNPALDDTQRLLVQKVAAVVIIITAFFVGVDLLGIDLTAFAVFSGALGLAVGFGLQKTFGNLIAGIILLMDRSIKPGDVIVVGGAVGRVSKIGVRAVSVVTRDGKEHLVPNELLMTERVENWSYSSRDVRVRINVGVAYDCDLRLAQKLMLDAATEAPRVLAHPAPVVWVTGFGDSSVDHELRFWIADPEGGLGNIQGDVFMRIWDKFRDAGIAIPFPQREVRVLGWPDLPARH